MALSTTLITNAIAENQANGYDNATAGENLANAIVATIELLQITYASGLISGSPGSPVTGGLIVATIS